VKHLSAWIQGGTVFKVVVIVGAIAIGVLASALTASAAVVVNVSEPFATTVFVPCASGGEGEFVDLSGELHAAITLTVDANNVSGIAHFQPEGVRGVGEKTGSMYEGTGVTLEHFSTSLTDGRTSMTFVNAFQIIGRGGAVNSRVHETSHVTIAADGAVASVVDNIWADCH
jgi:hypothetical protein